MAIVTIVAKFTAKSDPIETVKAELLTVGDLIAEKVVNMMTEVV